MLQLNISRLTLSEDGDTFLALEKIPAMQRRRLSSIAKIALNSAIQSLQGIQVDYIVWSSQYGDEEKTLKILQDVLSDQTPSPTLFQPLYIMQFQVCILYFVKMIRSRPVWQRHGLKL